MITIFDYKKEIDKLKKNVTIMNLEGRSQTIQILSYLEVCPYIDIVAEYMACKLKDIYGRLKYHLDQRTYLTLLADLYDRKNENRDNMSREYKEKLKEIDKNKK